MRAVIFSTGEWAGIAPLNEYLPAPLLPLMDRPFLQHVIENLAAQGVRRFDLVLSHLPEKIENFLGDGQRWGCTFTFHLVKDPARPYGRLRTLAWTDDAEPILLGHADRLPRLPLAEYRSTPSPSALFVWQPQAEGNPVWTGWAVLNAKQLKELPADADEAAAGAHLFERLPVELRRVEVPRPLSCENFDAILVTHQAVLRKDFDGLLLTAREVEPGIWLSRNVALHPTARPFPPIYIGENCEIGEGVTLGPNVVIGSGCVLDARSIVTNSVIFSGSYIGEALELSEVIIDKNRLINARMGAVVDVKENFILGNLAEKHIRRLLARQVGRGLGIVLLVLSLPLLLGVALFLKLWRQGPVVYRKEVVRLPAPPGETSWDTFRLWSFSPIETADGPAALHPASRPGLFLRFLPALVNIAQGQLSFVGVPPRSREEVRKLPRDWQAIYLAGKPGIVTEAAVVCGVEPNLDEQFATETVYVASAGWRHDLRLLVAYFYRAVFGFGVRMDEEQSAIVP